MLQQELAHFFQYSQEIIDSVDDGMFTVDLDLKITSINQAATVAAGVSRDEALGRHCYDVFRLDLCKARCPVREALREGVPVHRREGNTISDKGCRSPVFASASLLHDWCGEVIGAVETICSRSFLNATLDSFADGVFTIDDNMVIQSFNRAAEEISGYTQEEAIGRHCHEIFRTNLCHCGCLMREAVETGQSVVNREMQITHRDGHKKTIAVSASVLVDSDGSPHGVLQSFRDLSAVYALDREATQKFSFKNLVSRNPAMRRLFGVLEDVAGSDATVFLHGESGTGKELFARAIHDLSPRREGPLVTVNCGALPETLLEAEIFGVRKGAYTGAVANRPGRLELCRGGTFFLDEIGDLPLPLQVKLLRVLENKEFQPLGASTPIKADVRFITATHRNLEQMVEEGTFRRDLYFRINIVKLNIPPLRERKEDIPLLVEMALARFNDAYGRSVQRIAPDVVKCLLNYNFPGNIRELMNLIEQAVILCKGKEITIDLLPQDLCAHECESKARRKRASKSPDAEVLTEVISRHKGDRAAAANELGVDRTTLWRWVKSAGLCNI